MVSAERMTLKIYTRQACYAYVQMATYGCTALYVLTTASVSQEVSVLAKCCSPNITEYFASIMLPGTTELLIIMELMATSLSDLVSTSTLLSQHTAHAKGYWIVYAISFNVQHQCCTIQNPQHCILCCLLSPQMQKCVTPALFTKVLTEALFLYSLKMAHCKRPPLHMYCARL